MLMLSLAVRGMSFGVNVSLLHHVNMGMGFSWACAPVWGATGFATGVLLQVAVVEQPAPSQVEAGVWQNVPALRLHRNHRLSC